MCSVQEAFVMRKIIGLILVLCLVFSVAAECFAAGKPEITEQPKSAATSKKGVVSFNIKVKANGSSLTYTWYFVNPQTGEKVTGKKLNTIFKKIQVANPNSRKITLKRVPEEMYGWQVYCHITGNGYKIDSYPVVLGIYGKEMPPEPERPVTADGEGGNGARVVVKSDKDDDYENPVVEIADRTITVKSSASVLYALDNKGNPVKNEPSNTLEFNNRGSFLVKSDDKIKSWTINGIRIEPAEPITEFKVININDNVSLSFGIIKTTAATAALDESNMCKVTCQGCTFTFFPKGIKAATDGSVPAGALINVVASDAKLIENGYSVNNGFPSHEGQYSFQLTVTGDTTITLLDAETAQMLAVPTAAPVSEEAPAEASDVVSDDADDDE